MRKISLKLLVGLCTVFLISAFILQGCAQPAKTITSETTAAAETTVAAGETTTTAVAKENSIELNAITWRTEDADFFREANKNFEDLNPNIKISMDMPSSSNDIYYAALKTRIMGKGELDLFAVHPDAHFFEYAEPGLMEDLTGMPILSELNPALVANGTYNGKVYGVPQCTNVTGLFYNIEMFDKFGLTVPKDWADFINVCQKLKENNIEPISIGLGDPWTSVWLVIQLETMVHDANYYPMLEKGEKKFTDPEWYEMLNGIAELGSKGYIIKGAVGTMYEQSITLFATGKTAMLDSGTWSAGGVLSQNPDIKIGYFTMPYPRDGVEIRSSLAPSQMWCINSLSTKKEAARKYIEYLYGVDAQKLYGEQTKQIVANINAKIDDPLINSFMEMAKGGIVGPHYNCTEPKISSGILFEIGARALLGDDVKTILEDAQKQVDTIISNKG